MAIDLDDEILQDFLVEAGEILELLSEQLVDLEQSPEDADLLNAVFRGFHTVKGGAGFLAIDPMVDCCHVCEDVFNVLRQGERAVTSGLMDSVLQGLDCVQTMFAEIQSGEDPTPASPDLLAQLKVYATPGDEEPGGAAPVEVVDEAPAEEVVEEAPAAEEHDETDDEFEALLDAMDSGSEAAEEAPAAASDSDEITDEEFEALLDDIHGKGKHGGKPSAETSPAPAKEPAAGGDDLITDEEFDALLDDIHGKGKGPTGDKPAVPAAKEEAKESKPPAAAAGGGDELITDDEFDALLDDIHGKGKGPTGEKSAGGKAAAPKPEPAKPAAAAKPAAPAKPCQYDQSPRPGRLLLRYALSLAHSFDYVKRQKPSHLNPRRPSPPSAPFTGRGSVGRGRLP